jgi:hypothetical protein
MIIKSCQRCGHREQTWYELFPKHYHRYQVICRGCRTFIKWGAQRDVSRLPPHIVLVPYEPPRTLDEFFR